MNSLYSLGKMVVMFGILITITGGILMLAGKFTGFGKLPGDIFIQRGNFTFYFPVVTMLVVSLVLTLLLNLIIRK